MAGPAGKDERGRSSGSHGSAPIFGYRLILDGASLRAPKPLANGRPRGSLLFTFHHSPSTPYSLLTTEAVLMARGNAIEIAPGAFYRPGYLDRAAQEALLADVRGVGVAGAPLYHPRMPRSGKAFSVRMTGIAGGSAGLGYRRLSLPGGPSRNRRALALHPGVLLMVAWRDLSGFSSSEASSSWTITPMGISALACIRTGTRKSSPRLSSRSRSATRRSSASAARNARGCDMLGQARERGCVRLRRCVASRLSWHRPRAARNLDAPSGARTLQSHHAPCDARAVAHADASLTRAL